MTSCESSNLVKIITAFTDRPTMDLIHEDETPTMDLIHEDDTVKTVALIQDGSEKKVVEVSSSALTVVKNILDIKFLKNPVMILIALV